jgi:hypothetical protein
VSRSKSGETTTAAMLDEGARTMGVWLPLALADIAALLFGLIRMWTASPEKIAVPTRAKTLASWCLPMMAKSLEAGEKEAEALELLRSVERLAARQKKETAK